MAGDRFQNALSRSLLLRFDWYGVRKDNRVTRAAPAMASSGHCVCGVRAPTPQASRNLRLESVGLWRTAPLLAGTASRSGISCAWLLSNQKPCSQYIRTIK